MGAGSIAGRRREKNPGPDGPQSAPMMLHPEGTILSVGRITWRGGATELGRLAPPGWRTGGSYGDDEGGPRGRGAGSAGAGKRSVRPPDRSARARWNAHTGTGST